MAIIKQYVNLDPAKAAQLDGLDKARAGKSVVFEATIDPKKAGIQVIFEITRGAKNVTRKGEVSKIAATTDDEGKAKLPFDLTTDGGDEFTVKASLGQGENKDQQLGGTDTYVVWRRLYYQMSRFKAGTPGAGQPGGSVPEVGAYDISSVGTELAAREHNIELVDKTTTALIDRYANVLTDENDSSAYKKSARDSYDKTLEPVAMRVVIVHQIAKPATGKVRKDAVANATSIEVTIPVATWNDPTQAKEADWLVTGEWRFNGDTTWHPIPAAWITRTAPKKASIAVDVGALGAGGAWYWRKTEDQAKPIDVQLTYRSAAGSTNGSSWYNAIWLASDVMNRGARSPGDMKQTAIHEIGHFIKLVPPVQTTHYIEHGHQGGHCTTGLSATDVAKPSYQGLSGTCIMFGESATSRLPRFCDVCDPSVRQSAVTRAGIPATW